MRILWSERLLLGYIKDSRNRNEIVVGVFEGGFKHRLFWFVFCTVCTMFLPNDHKHKEGGK